MRSVALNFGAISGCASADDGRFGVLRIKIISEHREQARRMYYGSVPEIKKEIPAKFRPGEKSRSS